MTNTPNPTASQWTVAIIFFYIYFEKFQAPSPSKEVNQFFEKVP